ncbi:MAG TPA: hypothetical protein VGC09_00615 [Rhodopila sp.]
MTATLIATTSTRDLQPLGTGGRLAIDAAEPLMALLRHRLSAEHAALFAEPHVNASRGEVDWYAEGTGPAVPLPDLSPEQAAPVRAQLDRLSQDILGEIARLRAAPGESDHFLAEMLEFALRLPDKTAIRVRDGRAVLVGWGHARAGEKGEAVGVLGHVRASRLPMEILPPPVLPQPAGWRLWPWAVSLCCALLLLGGAGWYGMRVTGTVPAACRVDPAGLDALAAWRAADARNAALHGQLAALLHDAGQRRLQCPPAAASVAPAPPAMRDEQRAQQRGGRSGRLQIILAWDDTNDLDLHVFCPDNEQLWFQNPSACGGVLDVDANAERQSASNTPVENMRWADPPAGTYKVAVDPFEMRDTRQSRFRITVRQEGQPDRVQEGVAMAGRRLADVLEVTVSGGASP